MKISPYKSGCYTDNEASDTKAFSASQATNGTAIAPIVAQPVVNTEVAETPDETQLRGWYDRLIKGSNGAHRTPAEHV